MQCQQPKTGRGNGGKGVTSRQQAPTGVTGSSDVSVCLGLNDAEITMGCSV